jgi:hypothetical protein
MYKFLFIRKMDNIGTVCKNIIKKIITYIVFLAL